MIQAVQIATRSRPALANATFEEIAGAFVALDAELARLDREGCDDAHIERVYNRCYAIRDLMWTRRPSSLSALAFKLELAVSWAEESGPHDGSPLRRCLADLRALSAAS